MATKLARHFVADTPPPALVDRLSVTFTRSGGSLPALYRTLVEAPEAWSPAPAKFKTPWSGAFHAARRSARPARGVQFAPLMTQLGQPVWRPGSPAGYDDIAASWAAPDALVRRVELAQRVASQAGGAIDARTLAPLLLPGAPAEATTSAIARAESGATALALLLVSPSTSSEIAMTHRRQFLRLPLPVPACRWSRPAGAGRSPRPTAAWLPATTMQRIVKL